LLPVQRQTSKLVADFELCGARWLNKGVFISVGSRRPGIVIYEAYLVA